MAFIADIKVSLHSLQVDDVTVTREALSEIAIVSSEIENQEQCHWAPLSEIYVIRLFLDS